MLVSTTYQVEDTFHTRSDTNVECLSLRYNPNKSYACVLARLAQCNNSTVTAFLLKLRPIGFKKYHLLFPNYTSAFISSFNCLYQRDQDGHTSSRNFPEKVALELVKLHKKLGNCSNIVADSVAPTESINFISLGGDSLTDEGYNLR